MNKQRGFTLIELIIVIIILGILAVTAAPRFFDFAGDARISTLKGVEGSMNGAASLIYGKAVIDGINTIDQDGCVSPDFDQPCIVEGVQLKFGYPTANAEGIIAALQLSSDWLTLEGGTVDTFLSTGTVDEIIAVYPSGITVGSTWNLTTGCFVKYEPATSATTTPTVTVVDGEC